MSVEPCGCRILACGSYRVLRQLRSSLAFPASGRFAADNEPATTTITTTTTGADSAAANGVTISNGVRVATGALSRFDIRKLFDRSDFGMRLLFSLFVIFGCAFANSTRRRYLCLYGLLSLRIEFCTR